MAQKKPKKKKIANTASFIWHLEELRQRIIYIVIALVIATLGSYIFSEKLIYYFSQPIENLVFIHPLEGFITRIKVSFLTGFLISLPVFLYNVWKFVAIALTKKEKRIFIIYLPILLIIFLVGASFAYFVVMPLGIKFLLSSAGPNIQPMITMSNYFSMLMWMLIIFGFVFELPVVIYALSSLGIITPDFLKKNRKKAIVIIFITAALLTPPDVFTQLLLALPLTILFEISIWLSKIAYYKKVKREKVHS